jgi:hypothetical protein
MSKKSWEPLPGPISKITLKINQVRNNNTGNPPKALSRIKRRIKNGSKIEGFDFLYIN